MLYNFIKQLIRIFSALMEGVNNCNKPAFGLSPADGQELWASQIAIWLVVLTYVYQLCIYIYIYISYISNMLVISTNHPKYGWKTINVWKCFKQTTSYGVALQIPCGRGAIHGDAEELEIGTLRVCHVGRGNTMGTSVSAMGKLNATGPSAFVQPWPPWKLPKVTESESCMFLKWKKPGMILECTV